MAISILAVAKKIIRISAQGAVVAALVTIAYTMWNDSKVESTRNGETKALLTITTKQLEESKTENLKLQEEKNQKQSVVDTLHQQLLAEQVDNKYTKKLLEEANTKIKAQEIQLEQLARLAKASDLCTPLRLQIAEIEELLQRSTLDAFSPKGAQREQLVLSLSEKTKTLNICLSARR